jgi:hypothetical protein
VRKMSMSENYKGCVTLYSLRYFDIFERRKEFGMNSGIPFIKIADPVQVTVSASLALPWFSNSCRRCTLRSGYRNCR